MSHQLFKPRSILASKTFWTGATAVLGGAAGIATGAITPAEGANMIVTGLIGIFLRTSINKSASGDL